MADETEDVSNMEQVSICARFVHNYEVMKSSWDLWLLQK